MCGPGCGFQCWNLWVATWQNSIEDRQRIQANIVPTCSWALLLHLHELSSSVICVTTTVRDSVKTAYFCTLTRSLSRCQLPLVSLSRWQLSQRWRKPRCFDLACKTAWNPAVRFFLELHFALFKMPRVVLLQRTGCWYIETLEMVKCRRKVHCKRSLISL